MTDLPTYDDVASAAERIHGIAHRTPVVTSSRIDGRLGCSVFLKCENLQRMGAFKFRGAYNALSRLGDEQRRRGVVAYSSGNHAQAVALSARILGIPATIVMPTDAPASKVAATREYGARIVTYDRYREDREQIGRELADRDGLALVPPYNHPHVIAGQGTAALELLTDVPDLDAILVPLGGGGLLSGTLLAVSGVRPGVEVYGVEPENGDDARRSLERGSIVHIDTPETIADGAQTQHLGDLTFAIIREHASGVLTVPDTALVDAMRTFASTAKLVVEPTGCLGYAALAAAPAPFRGRRVGVVLSGGNVDLDRFAALIAA